VLFEEVMKLLDELSGLFIPISERTASVPLFGDLSGENGLFIMNHP
jgi:hypothetical protein